MSKLTGRSKNLPYMPFYIADWNRDKGVRKTSLAARGLWMEMLFLMWDETPRGVLTEDAAGVASILGQSPALVAQLIQELESNRVFSRGAAVNAEMTAKWPKGWPEGLAPLPGNAIVNRRMYRQHVLSCMRAASGRKGGKKSTPKPVPSTPEGKGDLGGCSNFSAKQNPSTAAPVGTSKPADTTGENISTYRQTEEANGKQNASYNQIPDTRYQKRSITADTQSTSQDPRPVQDIIGSAIKQLPEPGSLSAIVSRIRDLTQEDNWVPWWTTLLTDIAAHNSEGLGVVLDKLDYMAKCADPEKRKRYGLGPLKRPGQWLVSEITTWCGRHRITWPQFPPKTQTPRDAGKTSTTSTKSTEPRKNP